MRKKIPFLGLRWSLLILLGVFLMQLEQAGRISLHQIALGVLPVLVATFAYPLGNRKMMEICEGRLDTFQRVLGMTLASLPFWFILSLYCLYTSGPPAETQIIQSDIVAIFSGVIATVLFFKATDLVRGDMAKLLLVEATQSLEVLFALFGEMVFLSIPIPR